MQPRPWRLTKTAPLISVTQRAARKSTRPSRIPISHWPSHEKGSKTLTWRARRVSWSVSLRSNYAKASAMRTKSPCGYRCITKEPTMRTSCAPHTKPMPKRKTPLNPVPQLQTPQSQLANPSRVHLMSRSSDDPGEAPAAAASKATHPGALNSASRSSKTPLRAKEAGRVEARCPRVMQ